MCTVLDRVQKYFAESGCDFVSFSVWKIGDFVDELDQRSAVLRSQLAARRIQLGVAERTSMPSSQHGPSAAERIMVASDSDENGRRRS